MSIFDESMAKDIGPDRHQALLNVNGAMILAAQLVHRHFGDGNVTTDNILRVTRLLLDEHARIKSA